MKYEKKPVIVAFDVDGHLLRTEEFAYPAYFDGLRAFFKDDAEALSNIQRLIAPENDGKRWFTEHFMGHSHKEITDEINKSIVPHAPISIMTFKNEFLPEVDGIIADGVTPDYIYPGIWEMFEDLSKMEKMGLVKIYFISGSAIARLKTSFKNSKLDSFITDFDKQVFSGENYVNKTEVLKQLAKGDLMHIMYSGDGYGDVKSCKNVIDSHDVYFIGKSEGEHCIPGHREELIIRGVDAITKSGYELHREIIDRIKYIQEYDRKVQKIAEIYLARGTWQHII